MVCRRCQRRFREEGDRVCPYCGESNPPVTSGVMKTSTILISEGHRDAVYHSVSEVPARLRRRLLKSTGRHAETILIADQRGKEELAKAIRRLPESARQKVFAAVFGPAEDGAGVRFSRRWRLAAFACLVVMLAAFVFWFVRGH